MKTVLLTLAAGLAMVFAVSTAEAGGGTKPNSTIIFKNNAESRVAAIVDPSDAIIALLSKSSLTTSDLNKFKKAGGKIVNSGGTTSFAVLAGAHVVAAVQVNTSTGAVGDSSDLNVTTKKGKTITVSTEDSDGFVLQLD